jgi:hypothetical protein
MFDELAVNGDSVYEGAVLAVEVDQLKLRALQLKHAVPKGDCGIDESQIIGSIAADRKPGFGYLLNRAGK